MVWACAGQVWGTDRFYGTARWPASRSYALPATSAPVSRFELVRTDVRTPLHRTVEAT
jgi:hypothetical protein